MAVLNVWAEPQLLSSDGGCAPGERACEQAGALAVTPVDLAALCRGCGHR
jgi:hypothetical protein